MPTPTQQTYQDGHTDGYNQANADHSESQSGSGSPASSGGGGASGSSKTITSPTNSARTIAGLMGFTVLFSLIGNEIKVANGASNDKLGNGLHKGGTIIVGGFIAAALLTALTGAGEAGRKFAVGLAGVSAATSLLVYGGPVWSAISNVTNAKVPTTTPTGATKGTTPTTGTATGVALAQAA